MFDEDGGGFIDGEEVEKLVVSLLKLTGTIAEADDIADAVKGSNADWKSSKY